MGARRRWRRALVGLILSIALHAALLGGLMLRRAEAPPPPAPTIEVVLLRPTRAPAPATDPALQPRTPPAPPSLSPADPRLMQRRAGPVGSAPAPSAAAGDASASNPPPLPAPPSTASDAPPVDMAAVRDALRGSDCSVRSTLSARDRQRCLDRAMEGARQPPLPPTTAQRHAREKLDDARWKANRRLGEMVKDPAFARCAGGGICHRDLPVGIPFGRIPHASPVIPPSTLRGDDDALRPKPKPQEPG